MQKVLLFALLGASLLLAACNRKANRVVTDKTPVTTVPDKEKELPEMAEFDPAHYEGNEMMESETLSRSGQARMKALKEQRERIAKTGEQEMIAQLQKTGCYGECPVFTLKIMTDNSLRYEGVANVDLIGKFTGTVDFNPMSQLVILSSNNRFYRMPDSYPENKADAPTDLPSTITSINWRGRAHTVEHIINGPKELIEIENYLLSLIEKVDWTEVIED